MAGFAGKKTKKSLRIGRERKSGSRGVYEEGNALHSRARNLGGRRLRGREGMDERAHLSIKSGQSLAKMNEWLHVKHFNL